jgi:hypothetical protein
MWSTVEDLIPVSWHVKGGRNGKINFANKNVSYMAIGLDISWIYVWLNMFKLGYIWLNILKLFLECSIWRLVSGHGQRYPWPVWWIWAQNCTCDGSWVFLMGRSFVHEHGFGLAKPKWFALLAISNPHASIQPPWPAHLSLISHT